MIPQANTVDSIGYTTPASSAHSGLYSSDIGKMINAPVLHVNGDYPEGELLSLPVRTSLIVLTPAVDVARAVDVAFKYRNHFRKVNTRLPQLLVELIHVYPPGHHRGLARISSLVRFAYVNTRTYTDYPPRGHNELDEPSFTQPLMYEKIRSRSSVPVLYEKQLIVRPYSFPAPPCY